MIHSADSFLDIGLSFRNPDAFAGHFLDIALSSCNLDVCADHSYIALTSCNLDVCADYSLVLCRSMNICPKFVPKLTSVLRLSFGLFGLDSINSGLSYSRLNLLRDEPGH